MVHYSEPIIYPSINTNCKNIVYSNGVLVCADTGEVIEEHPIAMDIYYNAEDISRNNPSKIQEMYYADIVQKIIDMYRNGVPIREIMNATGIRSCRVIYDIIRSNIPKRRSKWSNRKITHEEIARICEMYRNSRSIYSIAKELGRATSTVHYVIHRYCRESSNEVESLEKLGRLFGEKAEIVMKVLRGELTTWDVAKMLNVSPRTIYNWIRKAKEVLGK